MTEADAIRLESFKKSLYQKGLQKDSVVTYLCGTRRFLDFMENKRLNKDSTKKFVDYLNSNFKPAIVKTYVISVNQYLEFIGRAHRVKYTGSIANNSKPLIAAEYRRLLAAAKNAEPVWLYYIIETLCASGLPNAKLKYLTVEALNSGVVKYIDNPKIERICYLPSNLCVHLKEYAEKAGIEQGIIFADENGKPLFRGVVLDEIKKLSTAACVDEEKLTFDSFIGLYNHTRESMEREIVDRIDLLRGYHEEKYPQ